MTVEYRHGGECTTPADSAQADVRLGNVTSSSVYTNPPSS